MKKLAQTILIVGLLAGLFCIYGYGANTTIQGISTTMPLPRSNDYLPTGGDTAGTQKLLASRLTFLTATRTTLAALNIANAADGVGITVLGATAAGDGGGAAYFWSASSTATPNGNTVILPASAPGTGRWLKAVGGVGFPGASTLGGIYSNAGTSHFFVTAINTDGTVTLVHPSTSDISGLGTIATQASNSVFITGGTIDNTVIGGSSPLAGTFTTLTATSLATVGTGGAATQPYLEINGGTNSGTGPSLILRRGGAAKGSIGTASYLIGGTGDDLVVQAEGALTIIFRTNATQRGTITSTGLNSFAIGATSASTGAFTSLSSTSGSLNGALGSGTPGTVAATTISATGQITSTVTTGTAPLVIASTTAVTNLNASLLLGSTWAIPGAIGSSTPAAGTFTSLSSASGALNGTLGASTRNTIAATTLNLNGQFTSTITTGTAPLVIASTTVVTNLNAAFLNGATMTAPGAIGSGTPSTGAFTTLTSTGGALNGTIGAGTPAAGTFTTVTGSVTSSGATTARTLAAHFGDIVNVKDFGATGNGSTDDTTSINSAIGALTNYSTLYFPEGKYIITTALNGISSLNHITITGDGWSSEIHSTVTGAAGNTFTVASTCSYINIRNLAITGAASTRGNGIHIRLYSSNSSVKDCFLSGCSDFAIHVSNDGATWSSNVEVSGNTIVGPLGDGIHVGNATEVLVENNIIRSTGDDGIGIVADSTTYVPTRVKVLGNIITSAGGLGTSVSGCGIRVAEANDCTIQENDIAYPYEAGIRLTRYLSTSNYNTRCTVTGNKILNGGGHSGSNSIDLGFVNYCLVQNNYLSDGLNGVGIMLLDCQDLTIEGNKIRGMPTGGFRTDSVTTANVASTWQGLVIKNNEFESIAANEVIYAVPASGKTITNLFIDGNVSSPATSGIFIYYDRITTGRVVNNTRLNSDTISGGGSVSGVTLANNN